MTDVQTHDYDKIYDRFRVAIRDNKLSILCGDGFDENQQKAILKEIRALLNSKLEPSDFGLFRKGIRSSGVEPWQVSAIVHGVTRGVFEHERSMRKREGNFLFLVVFSFLLSSCLSFLYLTMWHSQLPLLNQAPVTVFSGLFTAALVTLGESLTEDIVKTAGVAVLFIMIGVITGSVVDVLSVWMIPICLSFVLRVTIGLVVERS